MVKQAQGQPLFSNPSIRSSVVHNQIRIMTLENLFESKLGNFDNTEQSTNKLLLKFVPFIDAFEHQYILRSIMLAAIRFLSSCISF